MEELNNYLVIYYLFKTHANFFVFEKLILFRNIFENILKSMIFVQSKVSDYHNGKSKFKKRNI